MLSEIPPPTDVAASEQQQAVSRPRLRGLRWWVSGVSLCLLAAGGWWLSDELETSEWQARQLARYASEFDYRVAPGPSDQIRFPQHGPFDERLGYTALPLFTEQLTQQRFNLTQQVRINDALARHVDRGMFLPYQEKAQAGLTVFDCRGEELYRFRYPYRAFPAFADIPPVIWQGLLFIENRHLLDESRPHMNPAVDWVRFARAAVGQAAQVISDDLDTPGGSTLATQIEKYRHSPQGITHNGPEKIRQMASAAVRAYLDGEVTLPARRQLVLDYLNTVPLSAAPRHGEVHGIGDGLWAWFGSDFQQVNQRLSQPLQAPGLQRMEQGQALRQVVALMIAHRRPSWYLGKGRQDLEDTTSAYLRLMTEQGIITAEWRDAALPQRLRFRDMRSNPPMQPVQADKGSSLVRIRLARLLNTSLYNLDRLDARMDASLHADLQAEVNAFLSRLGDPAFARTHGLLGDRLLSPSRLKDVHYSFTLLERTPEGNKVRVQTDTSRQALDINEGSKLELGSTAKLRVLTTYLELVAELHQKLSPQDDEALKAIPVDARDELTQWAIQYLRQAEDRSLPPMLEAALERRFSASPAESFFTGGGLHVFGNFNEEDDARIPTLRESMQASINLPFVRLMREIVRHVIHQTPGSVAALLGDDRDPRRRDYLAKFADREGQTFVRRFWRKTEGRSSEDIRDSLFEGLRPTADRLAAVFRYIEPQSTPEALQAFLNQRLGKDAISTARAQQLHQRYAPEAFGLPDRGYIARVHPLELWVVAYRLSKPQATLTDALRDSAAQRQEVYGWLFQTRAKEARDSRIYTMLEVEAFLEIHRRWSRLGYPFPSLVPSLATALGSSGDRPAALAELMGIIANDGQRWSTRRIDAVRFAEGTPYETAFAQQAGSSEQVMPPEVARALKGALSEVVERGTARRLSGAFADGQGGVLAVGGKTGTGDNRIVVRGKPTVSLNRTATFVFYLGPRHFGTITAYVVGPDAARYRFTSGLPVQILRAMGPTLVPHLTKAEGAVCQKSAP